MISTRGRYALRVLIELALRQGDGYVPIRTVAEAQGISLKYLEQILPVLRNAGIVKAVSGKGGGYRLDVDASNCRVGEILRLMEGDMAPVSCLAFGAIPCPRKGKCLTLPIWREYDKITREYFDGITIADLIAGDGSG